ncbi:hypothetical protein [Brachyspira pilosicoli]|uniref:hypothetical protein n=1 Tax=Brachyspira pilosicoli TaxID=52584 RepID=UPI001CA4AEE6|nr:hypothetical protein [Brachyspira pilosicoli]MBW5382868.1 hypothetical protein [Brachyspira pilosicoli]
MSAKILNLISVLFLISLLAVSCSNVDKTGSDSNTSKGLSHYAGTWIITYDQQQKQNTQDTMTIKNDGTIELYINKQTEIITDIVEKGNEIYEAKFTPNSPNTDVYILTLTFTGDTAGTFTLSIGDVKILSGTLTKQ